MTNKFIEQRVEALENELSELKLIVAQIRKPSTVVEEALAEDIIEFEGKQYKRVDRDASEGDVIITSHESGFVKANKHYKVARCNEIVYIEDAEVPVYNVGRTPETVDVYELIVEDKPKTELGIRNLKVITPNQLRAEIIEKAKGFVESQFKKHWNGSGDLVIGIRGYLYSCEFISNKNSSVALLRKHSHKKVEIRGIAKCMPGDVFNEHIGKAIALGRALGLDVSEFEQAVQPTEQVIGHIVMREDGYEQEVKQLNYNKSLYKIINDTNAQYGGVE